MRVLRAPRRPLTVGWTGRRAPAFAKEDRASLDLAGSQVVRPTAAAPVGLERRAGGRREEGTAESRPRRWRQRWVRGGLSVAAGPNAAGALRQRRREVAVSRPLRGRGDWPPGASPTPLSVRGEKVVDNEALWRRKEGSWVRTRALRRRRLVRSWDGRRRSGGFNSTRARVREGAVATCGGDRRGPAAGRVASIRSVEQVARREASRRQQGAAMVQDGQASSLAVRGPRAPVRCCQSVATWGAALRFTRCRQAQANQKSSEKRRVGEGIRGRSG